MMSRFQNLKQIFTVHPGKIYLQKWIHWMLQRLDFIKTTLCRPNCRVSGVQCKSRINANSANDLYIPF